VEIILVETITLINDNQMAFSLEIAESKNFGQRFSKSLVVIVFIVLIGLIVGGDRNNIVGTILFGVLFFLLLTYRAYILDKFFITNITFNIESIEIIYKNSSTQVSLGGSIHEFSFKKKIAFRWNRTPYLAVYHKNELMISQYENGDWREKHFDQIIAEFKNAKNAMTSET
jgi:hypothetical protein